MEWDGEKTVRRLYRLGNLIVRIVGSVIFLWLTWYSFRYTQYMLPGGDEIPLNIHDSRTKNVLFLAVAAAGMVLLVFLERHMDRKVQFLLCRFTLVAVLVWIAAASLYWIRSSEHIPAGDQAFIYGGASYFIEGDYSFLGNTGYCGMHPHQLGLTALCEFFFRIVGTYNYYACELVCAFLAVGSVYCGYRILTEITRSTAVFIGYNILMLGCLPLIFYTAWVYGDIPSIFCALLAGWMLLSYEKEGKRRYLAIMVFSLVMAMLVRKNSLILLIAVCIAGLLHALLYKDKRIVLALLSAVVFSYGSYEAIYKMYEIRSGYEHCEGIPIIAWVTMGMQETNGICGWYNDYPKKTYYSVEYDREMTKKIAKQDLIDRLREFKNNPSYAGKFFKEKVLSQWNEPLYQALFFNADSPGEEVVGLKAIVTGLGSAYYIKVLAVCDRWQFVIYVGMLCYFLFGVKRDSSILQHVLAITMIGGFFFSIIYEAKARYIFSYYVMMFPFAAYGYRQAIRKVMTLANKNRGDKVIIDIQDSGRAA